LPAAGVILNSLGRDATLFDVLIVGADDLAFFCGFLLCGRLFAMIVTASLWEAEWYVRVSRPRKNPVDANNTARIFRSVLMPEYLQDAQKGCPFAPAHPGAPGRAFHRIRP